MISPTLNNPRHRHNILLLALLLAFGFIYSYIVITNHYFYRSSCYDYGVYNQTFYKYAHLHSDNTFEPPLNNVLQIHITFTMYTLAPFYWLLSWLTGTYTLLIIQVLVLLLGGIGVYKVIDLKFQNKTIGLFAMLHYLLLWGHYSTQAADFYETTIGASFVPWFIYGMERKKRTLTFIAFIYILIAKENMALWLFFITGSLLLLNRNDKSYLKTYLIYMIASLLYFVVLYPVLLHYFQDPSLPYYGFRYSSLGGTPGEAIKFLFTHPIKAGELLFINQSADPVYDGIKQEFYIVFLLSGGVLLLLRPILLLAFLPIIAQKMYSDDYIRWGINGYYSTEVVSLLSISCFLALCRIKNKVILYIIISILIISTGKITYDKLQSRVSKWYNPAKENFFSSQMGKTDLNIEDVKKGLAVIPIEASVTATESLVPHLAFRDTVHCFPDVHESEYLAFLKGGSPYPLSADIFEKERKKYTESPDWLTVYDGPSIQVIKKK